MNSNLLDKNCPYCKTGFTETDDIVICGSCEMPHHKECWIENQGCTTFGCLGTIENLSNASPVDTSYYNLTVASEKVFCTQCGAENEDSSAFCAMCGTKLVAPVQSAPAPQATYTQPIAAPQATYTQPIAAPQPTYTQSVAAAPQPTYAQPVAAVPQPTYTQSAVTPQVIPNNAAFDVTVTNNELCQLIGKKTMDYSVKFQKLKQKNSKVSWNWAAFLFGALWFLYRKMYLYGFGMIVVNLLLNIIIPVPILSWVTTIIGSLLGDYLYMKEIEKKLERVSGMSEPSKSQHLLKIGGTSMGIPIVACVVVCVVLMLLSFMMYI